MQPQENSAAAAAAAAAAVGAAIQPQVAQALQLLAAGDEQQQEVLVSGCPREVAQAKHCEWALQRQPLEQLRQQAGVDEVLLSDSSGALLEGLVSNFYVIAEEAALGLVHEQDAAAGAAGADEAATPDPGSCQAGAESASTSSSSSSSSTAGLVLLTTGPSHAALPGVSQARVLQACQRLQLKVLQQPARLQQRHAWREAFLTNW
ncbi:hypothetical protein COO60DRAFT_1634067 [Scenedesmus sp. NREL 46B-D3]|nr:hypothetical protein COO60DRAFT_1634067 [Scenedesmus sp. NREL 46B-D3]